MSDQAPSWLPDAHPTFPGEDAFGVDELIDRVAGELEGAKPPFAISLSGSWGVGKSTIAFELVKRLRKSGVRCVFIDAWTLDIRQLRRHLVLEVGAALKPGKPTDIPTAEQRKEVADTIDEAEAQTTVQDAARVEVRGPFEVGRAIWRLRWSLIFTLILLILLVVAAFQWDELEQFFLTMAGVLALGLLTTYVLRISTPSRSRAPAASEVLLAEKFREIVSKPPAKKWLFAQPEPLPVIVVVDNLDRLSGKDALTALGEVRALLDIKDSRCVFMIPIDRRRLSDHLQEALKSEAAADFLEKFFGLDLALTQPEEVDLRRWAQQKAASLLPKADATELERMADVVVSAAGRFPRLIVRIINGAVTRHRVVTGMGRSLTLAQAALVEGVIVLAPSSLRNLEENPRALTDARDWIESEHQGPEKRLATALGLTVPDKQPPHPAVSEVLRFLRGTLDVPLAWEDVRVALALRKNRLWSLVPDWETFSAPMEEGNIEAFSDALSGRPDRDVIIQSAVQALIELRASTRLPNGIRVLAPYLDQPVPRADRLRELALAHFASNSWAFRRITDASARFLLDAPQPKLRMVSVSFVEAISETGTKIPHDPGITRAAVALRSLFTDQQLEAVRKELATWSREELKPLFADPSGTDFINGPVASLVISPLAAWDASVPDSMDEFADMAEQLREARDHGWYEQAGLDQIATQMAGQLTAMAANEPALPVGEAIVELLRDAEPSGPIDALAQGLAQEFANGSSFFHWAFRLKMSDSGMTAAIARFDGFAKSVSLEKIPPALDEHRALIDASASNYRQLLLGRWQTHGHELAATIAIEGEAGASSLVDAWRSAPVGSKLTRAQQAMKILRARGDEAALREIATDLEAAVLNAPFDLAGLEELTTWMLSSQVSRQHLVRGITAKIESLVSPSDLPPLLKAVLPKLPDLGVDQQRQIADALADKITQVGTFDPTVVGSVVPSMSASEAREDLVVKMLEAGHSLDATLEALDRCRPKVGPSGRVHDALVSRAAREQEQVNAARDLDEARKWRRPKAKLSAEAEADRETVYSRFPELRPGK